MESRLAEIEIKLSYSEDLLEELNRTVFRQQQQIEQLQQEGIDIYHFARIGVENQDAILG